MAYKTEELFKSAIENIRKHRLVFIEDIIAYLPCSKPTFYEHFPNESDYYKKMFEELEKNRIDLKIGMRSKWYKSNSPALQIALMKLIANEDELKRMSVTYNDHTTNGKDISIPPISWVANVTDEEDLENE